MVRISEYCSLKSNVARIFLSISSKTMNIDVSTAQRGYPQRETDNSDIEIKKA